MILRIGKSLLVGSAVAVTVFDNLGFPAVVEGTSMQPTLNPESDRKSENDVVFVCRWATRNYEVKKNDIVAVRDPTNPKHRIIKRVIGTGGDVVRTRRYKDEYVEIPDGHFWAESDNLSRRDLLDSNVFGPVSAGLVIGRATHIIWPPSRWQRLHDQDPLRRAPVARRPMPHILADD